MNIQKIFDMLSAASFAEEGEHEKALEFIKRGKTVLLALSGESFDRNGFSYAVRVAERIEAAVEILYVNATAGGKARLKELISEWKDSGYEFHLTIKKGAMKNVVMEYTRKATHVQFVIISGPDGFSPEAMDGKRMFEEEWRGLKCPLVVVSPLGTPLTA